MAPGGLTLVTPLVEVLFFMLTVWLLEALSHVSLYSGEVWHRGNLDNLPLQRWNIFYINLKRTTFYQLETHINVLVSSFRFIWIPMLWVYGHYTIFLLSMRGPSLDVRFWRLRTVTALKGLSCQTCITIQVDHCILWFNRKRGRGRMEIIQWWYPEIVTTRS